jgi:Asp/Glu/hydantoin racemase
MSGFVIFLILIGIIIVIKFASDSSGDTDKIVKEGGMRVKYKTLIDNFVDPESGLKIIKETNKYVCVGMNNAAGSLAFHFQHTFSVINVTYELKNVFWETIN